MTFCCDPQDPMDCVERATCEQAGAPGHSFCGTCELHGKPIHRCGCAPQPEAVESFADIMAEWDAMTEDEKQAKLDENFRELELLFDCE